MRHRPPPYIRIVSKTILFTAISLFFYSKTLGQNTKSLKLYSCETGLCYEIRGNEIMLEHPKFFSSDSSKRLLYTKIVSLDSTLFQKILFDLVDPKESEILNNNCVDDGFHYKIYIYSDGLLKKIFVGNYYDIRIDQLTAMFDKYLNKSGDYQLGYGNSNEINRLVENQKKCTTIISEEYKARLMNNWCELE